MLQIFSYPISAPNFLSLSGKKGKTGANFLKVNEKLWS